MINDTSDEHDIADPELPPLKFSRVPSHVPEGSGGPQQPRQAKAMSRVTESASPDGLRTSQPSGTQSHESFRGKRALVNAACHPCRKRRSKCDGQRPVCAKCIQKRSTCEYDVRPDETRQEAVKRKNETLEQELSSFRELHHALASRPESEASVILKQIRSGDDIDTVLTLISDGDLLFRPRRTTAGQFQAGLNMLDNPVAGSSSHVTQSSTTRDHAQANLSDGHDMNEFSPRKRAAREAPMLPAYGDSPQLSSSYRSPSASHTPYGLVDTRSFVASPAQLEARASYERPEFNVEAQLWTSVIRDNALMSHLLTVYFTYSHKFFCWFEKESFIEDLLQGGTDFCSPLLVNAVLALACISSHLLDVEQQSKPWVPGHLGRQFFEEARRHLFDEEGKESLTTVQALVTMAYVSCCNGRDRVGEIYYDRAFRTGQQMSLFRNPATWSRPGPDRRNLAQKLDRVRAKTAWGMFNYQTCVGSSTMRAEQSVRLTCEQTLTKQYVARAVDSASALGTESIRPSGW
ncbi:hypothetical protein LTR50_007094 [Elasticomyces elasticus]|nr:hypothetical protein LTR50_007094 [Elasticomyces elasticus]